MTSREKVLEVERQVREKCPEFHCPFCGEMTDFRTEPTGEELMCCAEAAYVVMATLEFIDHRQRCDVVDQAMEMYDKSQQVVLN